MQCSAAQFEQIKTAIAAKVQPEKFQPTLDQCLAFLEQKIGAIDFTEDGFAYTLNQFFVSQGIK